jgi:hypothetical protein
MSENVLYLSRAMRVFGGARLPKDLTMSAADKDIRRLSMDNADQCAEPVIWWGEAPE